MAFRKGDRVEVCVNEDGFPGSYYGATLIQELGDNLYRVQYKNLLKEDTSGLLTETVSGDELRPEPKHRMPTDFRLSEEVDAFDNDGWWAGKIVAKNGSAAYSVYFPYSEERITYPLYRLRVHEDWINGQWVSSKIWRWKF